jgi:hypothetical protein
MVVPQLLEDQRERAEDQEVEDATLRCCCCCSFELFFFLSWLMYWGTGFVHTPTPFIQVKLYSMYNGNKTMYSIMDYLIKRVGNTTNI